jgi:hypothetical protein
LAILTRGGSRRFPTPAHPEIISNSKRDGINILSDLSITIGTFWFGELKGIPVIKNII